MTAYSPTVIRNAIKSLLQGEIGAVRTLPSGMFLYGTYDGQPTAATKARAQNPAIAQRFDVKLGQMAMHGATPISANSPTKTVKVPVTIDIVTRFKAATLEPQRDEQRALAENNTQLALQALQRPGNLISDASDNPTGIVSGLLMGPDGSGHPTWDTIDEDWSKLLHKSRISGAVVVQVDQPVITFADILGGIYVDDWDRGLTASSLSWHSREARVLSAVGTPTYAVDGTNFRGNSVVSTSPGPNELAGTFADPVAANGSSPYIAIVMRARDVSDVPWILSLADSLGTDSHYLIYDGALKFSADAGAVQVVGDALDTNVHMIELWSDGSGTYLAVDGVLTGTPGATSTASADYVTLTLGDDTAQDTAGSQLNFSRIIVASDAPTTQQRADILALARSLDGF